MASSLSNLADNLSEELIELNVNTEMTMKNRRIVELNMNVVTVFLNI